MGSGTRAVRRWTFGSERRFALGLGVDGAEGVRLSASESQRALDAWLRRDGATALGRSQMREVLRALRVEEREDPQRLRSSLLAALRDGRLWMRVDRTPMRGTSVGAADERSSAASPPERVAEVDHWIAIRLQDDHDPPRPVPFARYTIKLPDGELRHGTLDKQGVARLDGIPAGECEVTFPDFDRRPWSPAKPRTAPAPRPPAPRKRVEPATTAATTTATSERCVVTGFEVLDDKGRRAKRQPGPDGVLRVVPEPTASRSFEQAFPFNLTALKALEDSVSEFNESASTIRSLFRSRGLGGMIDALRARDAAPRPSTGGGAPKVSLSHKITYRNDTGGAASPRVQPRRSQTCGRHHASSVASEGGGARELSAETTFEWRGGGPADHRARPTVYSLSADGCEGEPAALRVEVFPGDQLVCAVALEASVDLSEPVEALTRTLLNTTPSLDGSVTGAFELFSGWSEDETSWQVRHSEGWRFTLSGTVSGRVTVSALGVFLRWPPTLQKYVADVGVWADASWTNTLTAECSASRSPGHRALPEDAFEGKAETEGSFGLGIYASVGAVKLLGAIVEGGAETKATCEGSLEYDGEALAFAGEATWAPITMKVKLLGRALIWSGEDSWEFPVCGERSVKTRHVLFERKR